MHFRFLTGLSFVVFSSCQHVNETPHTNFISECTIGQTCDLVGDLSALRGGKYSVAILKDAKGDCISLAMPTEFYKRYDPRPRLFYINGRVLQKPQREDLLSFVIEDRLVAAGYCENGKIIYVENYRKI